MKKQQEVIRIQFFALLLFALLAPSILLGQSTSLTEVHIGYTKSIANLPLFVAQEEGYFSQNGIAPVFVKYNSFDAMLAAAKQGEIQMLGSIPLRQLLATKDANTASLKFTAAVTEQTIAPAPYDKIIVPRTSSIRSLSELDGKRIGILDDTAMEMYFTQIMEKELNKTPSITFVRLAEMDLYQAFPSKKINVDALFTTQPMANLIGSKRAIAKNALLSNLDRPTTSLPVEAFAFTNAFIESAPSIASKVNTSIDQAIQALFAGKKDYHYLYNNFSEVESIQISKLPILQYLGNSDLIEYLYTSSLQYEFDRFYNAKLVSKRYLASQFLYKP